MHLKQHGLHLMYVMIALEQISPRWPIWIGELTLKRPILIAKILISWLKWRIHCSWLLSNRYRPTVSLQPTVRNPSVIMTDRSQPNQKMPKQGYDRMTRHPSCPKKDILFAYKRKVRIWKRDFLVACCTLDFWFDFVHTSILSVIWRNPLSHSSTIITASIYDIFGYKGNEYRFRRCHKCSPL